MDEQTKPSKASKPKKKIRWKRWLIEILIIVAIFYGIKTWQQRDMVSGEAPEIMQVSMQGELVKIEDFKGKPFLIHFWATWCKICEIEHGWINNLNEDWPILTIATFDSGTKEEIQRYLERHQIADWNVVIDDDNSLAEHYGVSGTPSTFVIDSKGNIRFKEVGLTIPWGWRLRLWWTDMMDG